MGRKVKMNVLVHTRHAEQFNRLLYESGANNLRLIQVSELDPAIMMELSHRLDQGEWLAIAGDRVPLQGARIATANFLGQPAAFPQGPWLLAGLLQCPANLLFCLKHAGQFHVHLEPFADRVEWRRGQRDAVVQAWVQRYADRLAARCLEAPLQWFNFYPFWNTHEQR
jgi:predicted LPLAT superfamily acyltransferase